MSDHSKCVNEFIIPAHTEVHDIPNTDFKAVSKTEYRRMQTLSGDLGDRLNEHVAEIERLQAVIGVAVAAMRLKGWEGLALKLEEQISEKGTGEDRK